LRESTTSTENTNARGKRKTLSCSVGCARCLHARHRERSGPVDLLCACGFDRRRRIWGNARKYRSLGGIVGSVVVPAVSDGLQRRKPVVVTAVLLSVPRSLGLILGHSFSLAALCAFAMGFFVTGVAPVAYQYRRALLRLQIHHQEGLHRRSLGESTSLIDNRPMTEAFLLKA
jgi:hypothetical protein